MKMQKSIESMVFMMNVSGGSTSGFGRSFAIASIVYLLQHLLMRKSCACMGGFHRS